MALITLLLPLVDETGGWNVPDWGRLVAMLLLLAVDFPSIVAMAFYGGFYWPECLPTFICPNGARETLMVMIVHLPAFLVWLFVGFIVGKSRAGHVTANVQQG